MPNATLDHIRAKHQNSNSRHYSTWHYQDIALMLGYLSSCFHPDIPITPAVLASVFSQRFQHDNDRFKPAQFEKACKIPRGTLPHML